MQTLSNAELKDITGGSIFIRFHLIYKIYRTIKIKLLMKKLFIN